MANLSTIRLSLPADQPDPVATGAVQLGALARQLHAAVAETRRADLTVPTKAAAALRLAELAAAVALAAGRQLDAVHQAAVDHRTATDARVADLAGRLAAIEARAARVKPSAELVAKLATVEAEITRRPARVPVRRVSAGA